MIAFLIRVVAFLGFVTIAALFIRYVIMPLFFSNVGKNKSSEETIKKGESK